MPTIEEEIQGLKDQFLGEAGKTYTPQATLNEIGQPIFKSSQAELAGIAADRRQKLQALLQARGLTGSGIELGNTQLLEQNLGQLEQQSLRDALSQQNQFGLSEYQRSQRAKLDALMSLLDSAQKRQLASQDATSKGNLLAQEAGFKEKLQSQEAGFNEILARLSGDMRSQAEQRLAAMQNDFNARMQEKQATEQAASLKKLIEQQAANQASAANAANFAGAVAGLSKPFDIDTGLFPHKPEATAQDKYYNALTQGIMSGIGGVNTAQIQKQTVPVPAPGAFSPIGQGAFNRAPNSLIDFAPIGPTYDQAKSYGNVSGINTTNPYVGYDTSAFKPYSAYDYISNNTINNINRAGQPAPSYGAGALNLGPALIQSSKPYSAYDYISNNAIRNISSFNNPRTGAGTNPYYFA